MSGLYLEPTIPDRWQTETLALGRPVLEAVRRVRGRWANFGADPVEPDRRLVKSDLAAAYRSSCLPAPSRVLWFENPLHGAIAAELISRSEVWAGTELWSLPALESQRALRDRLSPAGAASLAILLGDLGWMGPLGRGARAHLEERIRAPDFPEVWGRIREALRARLGWRILPYPAPDPRRTPSTPGLGPLEDLPALVWMDLAAELDLDRSRLRPLLRLARGAGRFWPFRHSAILTPPPIRCARDHRNRLHHNSRMALEYPDGWGFHASGGVRLPAEAILHPDTLDPRKILQEGNQEVQRVLLELYGMERLVRTTGAQVISRDEGRRLFRIPTTGVEPILVVNVRCPSTGHQYFLRVPPGIHTCQEAVAWTFGKRPEEYRPAVET